MAVPFLYTPKGVYQITYQSKATSLHPKAIPILPNLGLHRVHHHGLRVQALQLQLASNVNKPHGYIRTTYSLVVHILFNIRTSEFRHVNKCEASR